MDLLTNTKDKEIYFVARKLNLPVFLMSRNRIKYNHLDPLRNYIGSKRLNYTRTCNQENATETATTKKQKHICGYYGSQRTKFCPTPRVLKYSRQITTTYPWQLSPNRYNVLKEPYKRLKGISGAYWTKLPTQRRLQPTKGLNQQWKFYDLCGDTERMEKPCNKHKGVFVTDARERRATTRCMVSSSLTCYRDPNFPGPAAYYPQTHLIKVSKKRKEKFPNPHVFLRGSCVPAKPNSIHKKNISFAPGPAQYETRFPKFCTCYGKRKHVKLTFQPGLQLIIDRQKRLKFRRQRYVKIQPNKYCSPDWHHVKGHGHRFLFKNIPPKPYEKPQLKKGKDAKKTARNLKFYPDARYIGAINDPKRLILSHRLEPVTIIPKRIYFNCVVKPIVRRQIRYNKNIAFNSGSERFEDVERAPILTVSELEAKKKLLPIERQLRDHPITTRRISEIPGKLNEIPRHMKTDFALQLRKRIFKFSPLPTAKILVTEDDLRRRNDDSYVQKSFIGKKLSIMDFLKKSVDDKDLQEIEKYRKMKKI